MITQKTSLAKILLILSIFFLFTLKIVYSQEQEKSPEEIIALAEEYSKTDEEEYDNKIYITAFYTSHILNNIYATLREMAGSEETGPIELDLNRENIEELMQLTLQSKKKIKRVKTEIEVIDVPPGYENIQENILLFHRELLEAAELILDGIENKDIDKASAGFDKITDSTNKRDEGLKELYAKGYKPSSEFSKIVQDIYNFQ